MSARAAALRALPSLDALLREERVAPLLARYPRALVAEALRAALADARTAVAGGAATPTVATLIGTGTSRLTALGTASLRPVVNASGVVLHTNLGRAALAEAALAAVAAVAAQPCSLELDLETGTRGTRDAHVEGQLCALSGAGAATVVNNNAAAV